MRFYWEVWLAVHKYLPYTKGGKLIFEPYRGFIWDLVELSQLENDIGLISSGGFISRYTEIEDRISYNTER